MSERHRWQRVAMVLATVLVIGGCQSLSAGRGAGGDIEQSMPGELSRTRYAPQIAAVAALSRALSAREVTLEGIPFDNALSNAMPVAATPVGPTPPDTVRRLAEGALLGGAPYRLVRTDLPSGRLEFRSERTGMHVSVYVRAPNATEEGDGVAFVVDDMFGQVSLAELVREQSSETNELRPVRASSAMYPVITAIGRLAGKGDVQSLAYFDSLPPVERDRNDLLGLRALLQLRLGRNKDARELVERGIVRYPESPLYLVLAKILFERSDRGDAEVPSSVAAVMDIRFTPSEIRASRRAVIRFLNEKTGV